VVRFCGEPNRAKFIADFGVLLSSGRENPDISIDQASVCASRHGGKSARA
jgi:hypothetical protein